MYSGDAINKVLENYDFGSPKAELIRHNENITYKVTDAEKSYLLRIHKPAEGLNLDFLRWERDRIDLTKNEMELLQYLATESGLQTQKVMPNIFGELVTLLDDKIPVTVLRWIEGPTLDNIDINEEIAYRIGYMIGRLHNATSTIKLINRYSYDSALLQRMIEEGANASAQGHFNKSQTKIIIETLSQIKDYLLSAKDRFMIVHTDLGKSNLIYYNESVIPIDFSLSGYCIPEMDLASVTAQINDENLNKDILNGYKSVCIFELDNLGIEACFCLQILLFIIAQHNRFFGESWFRDNLDRWCGDHFKPFIMKIAK